MVYTDKMADKDNFFSKLLNLFVRVDSPDVIKKRKLKLIAKNIAKTRYSKWYKSGAQELLPQTASFFYNIYKVVGQGRPLLAGALSSKVLKNITVEHFLTDRQKKMQEGLSEEAIKQKASKMKAADLSNALKKDLKLFVGEFDSTQTQTIDSTYENIENFIHFVLFDYYFLLKKFNAALPENNFTAAPVFQSVRGEYVVEELKDFVTVLYQLNLEADWKTIFQIIKEYKNINPVHEGQWKKLLSGLNDLKRSRALEYLIQHITGDILYAVEINPNDEKITDIYIENVRNATNTVINKIAEAQKSSKAAVLISRIFGDKINSGMKNYTMENHANFVKKGLPGYIYAEQMNCLKSFLIEYVKTDIRTLCDLFLVRGNWGGFAGTTVEYSDSFHAIMQLASKVVEFDEKLSEVSEMGVKFRTLLSRMDREKEAGRQALKLLNEVNGAALKLIKFSLKYIIVIGSNFKTIIADYDKPRRELIQNWKEIEQHSDKPIREWLVEAYKKIYDFVMLIQVFNEGLS